MVKKGIKAPLTEAVRRIEVRGALGGILRLAEGARTGKRADAAAADMLCEQVKVVAGTGFEPVTFRL